MNTNKQSAKRSQQKNSKQDKNSSGGMRIFYVLMLVLMLSSSVIRIAGASRHSQSVATPTPQVSPAGSGWTATRVFVFHHEDSGTGICTDLVIPATGSAVYSNCGAGLEKQYNLSDTERAQLQTRLAQFQSVNDEHTTGNVSIQLYLNGRGSQAASNSDIQSMVQFAENLIAKIASQP